MKKPTIPTFRNLRKPRENWQTLINRYQNEQEYIQGHINKIKNSVEDKQSRIS